MTVAQELSKMTPEVQNALLSAEGEKWGGMNGTPHDKNPKTICGSKEGRFTKIQRKAIRYLRHVKQSTSAEMTRYLGRTAHPALSGLVSAGWLQRNDYMGIIFYSITGAGEAVELKKIQKEEAISKMKKMKVFTSSDLSKFVSKNVAYKVIRYMVDRGHVELIDKGYRGKYRWIG